MSMTKYDSRAWNGSTNARRHVTRDDDVLVRAQRQLAKDCPSAYYFKNLHLDYRRGVLTVCGSVPTQALKWILESLLSHVDGVEQIDNQVSVVSATGLSSVSSK
jgi:hypothetical protein